ncbi:MAG TPA: D-2-hydroxyacid dehydrogenase family protein [Chloroflexota bacterium]|nr:D-2-hydroxyacid dehydrogenase family protein [Chloroflexota bacterium]
MNNVNVAVLDDWQDAWRQTDAIKRLEGRARVAFLTEPTSDMSKLKGFEVLIANRERTRFTAELLRQMPDARLLVQTGGRAPNVDLEAATGCGIIVAKAAGSGPSTGAAELTIGLILDVMRHITSADAAMHAGQWTAPLGRELRGKTLGLIGIGGVGGYVARLVIPFGVKLLAYSRSLTPQRAAERGAEAVSFEDLLRRSDVVSVHVPLTPESRGLIGAPQLELMKPSAYLINTSRGPVVEEPALVQALSSGRIAGAGLDVYDEEPLSTSNPLRTLPNAVLTPHLGWPTDLGIERFAEAAVEVVLAYIEGNGFERFN